MNDVYSFSFFCLWEPPVSFDMAATNETLSARQISQATGVALEKCTLAHMFLYERGDEVLFACSATKLTSGTDRLVLISRYRLLLVRWKWGRAAFRELRLIDLRGITCEGDAGAWGFSDPGGEQQQTAQIKTVRLQEAARATLKAHALITLCLDMPALALSLPKEWGAIDVFDTSGKHIDMGFSRTWLAVCSYTSAGGSGNVETAAAAARELILRRQRLASFLAQLISRPARMDRVLDLSFCAELTASDFAAAAGARASVLITLAL